MEKLDRKISDKILYGFNNAKEWPDLMSVIKELNSLLQKNNECNFKLIKEKITLARRLAQCLNSSLPAGLHENALITYDIILDNILKHNNNHLGNDLALYSSGLFPFFQNASPSNKQDYLLKIIKGKFLKMESTELELCLTGLLVSILPGLEEQNELITKHIKEIFGSLRERLSDYVFYGCLWSIIIRNQKLRLMGMKYINETIPPYKVFEECTKEQQDEHINKYFPQLNTMIINTVSTVVEDSDVQIVRTGMDFILKTLPLNCSDNLLTNDQKITLLISALNLLVKNEYSTTRRLSQWLLGTATIDDDIDLENNEIKNMISLLIEAFKRIFSAENTTSKKKLLNNLKVIEQLLNQQVSLSDAILENISYDIIMCIVKYWDTDLGGSETAHGDEIITKAKSFFNKDPSFIEWLWISLANNLHAFNAEATNDAYKMSNSIDNAIKPLKFCLLYININSNENKVKYYIPIISNLLKIMMTFKSADFLKYTKHIIFISLVFTKSLQEISAEQDQKGRSTIFLTVTTSIEDNLSEKIQDISSLIRQRFNISQESSLENIMKNKEYQTLLAQFTENILNFQNGYLKIVETLLQEGNNEPISRNEMRIFKQSTELIIRTQEYAQQTEVPQWLVSLEKATFCDNTQLSLEAASYLLNLLILDHKGEIYTKIKEDIRTRELEGDVISKEKLNNLIALSHIKPNSAEILMAMLWNLIEDQAIQKKVIDLLIKFSKTDLEIFINTIANTFVENNFDKNVNAIKKFSQFWKSTNELYPEVIFFKNGECIFKMLDFLDHEHPLLRHLAKSWLSQSVGQFNKILDPLLAVLLSKETSWKLGIDNKIYFDKEYDNRRIMDTFRKLKNIIINVTDLSIKYFIQNPSNRELLKMDTFGQILEENKLTMPRSTYLQLMVSISLRFIQGKVISELSRAFSRENYSVNAASCEFLEFLLSFIEPKSHLMTIALFITEPVLEILYQTIEDRDEVMQVQLLNLLKVLLFDTKGEHKKVKEEAGKMFTNETLRKCLIQGIQTHYFFVRGHFIYFVECCLPIFKEVLDLKIQQDIAIQLIGTTTDFLIQRVSYSKLAHKDVHKFSHANQKISFFIYKNYLEEYKEYKRYDENDINIIVKGLKEILFHFLEIKESLLNNVNNWVQFKKNFLSQYKQSSSLGDYLSSLFSKDDFDDKGNNESNPEMSQNIYRILGDLLSTFVIAWVNHSENYERKDYCLNNNGILAYVDMDYDYSRDTDLYYNDDNKKQVKNQIVEIAFNLFMKNPYEFISHFLSLWRNNSINPILAKDKQYKLSMIELLMSMNIPLNIIFLNIATILNKSVKYNYSKGNSKNLLTPYTISVFESQICHFIYSYVLLHNFDKSSKDANSQIIDIWNELIPIFEYYLKNSKIAYTICWLYEILNIMVNKYPIMRTSDEPNIKKRVIDIYNSLNKKLCDIAFFGKFDSVYETDEHLVLPILPSIYTNTVLEMFPNDDLYKKREETLQVGNEAEQQNNLLKNSFLIDNANDSSSFNKTNTNNNDLLRLDGYVNQFYHFYYDIVRDNQKVKKNYEVLKGIYRKITFLCLKSNYHSITKSLFIDRPNEITKMLYGLIRNLMVMMNPTGPNKADAKFFAELSTEFLQSLMKDCPSLTSSAAKQLIMDYFTNESFFKTTPKIIRLWKDIISNLSAYYHEIIDDLISQMDSGFFFSKGSNQVKIKTLRRISFVIYSCPKDTFSNKINIFKEKVKDLFITYGDISVLESEIFLMIRVLFLRFSHDNILEMIRLLWPIIFNELVLILENKKKNQTIRLMLESFKFIELLSLANIEEFSLYQWIFIVDTFDTKRLDTTDENSLMSSLLKKETQIFKPIAMNISNDWKSDIKFKGNGKTKSELIIVSKTQNESESEMIGLVKKFFYSIGDMNNFKVNVNYTQIEEVIEDDFLTINEDNTKK